MREWCREHGRLVKGSAALLLLALAGWSVWYFWPDPHLAQVQALQAKLRDDNSLPPEKRRELWGQLRREMEQLSPAQRRDLREEQREARQKQLADYFKLAPQERAAYLDRQIDRMEAMRREIAQMRAQNPNGQGPFRGQRPSSQEERERRRRDRLDSTTPEERAQRTEFFRDLQTRRQARGMGGFPWGRGPG
jgi:hypothetical protein